MPVQYKLYSTTLYTAGTVQAVQYITLHSRYITSCTVQHSTSPLQYKLYSTLYIAGTVQAVQYITLQSRYSTRCTMYCIVLYILHSRYSTSCTVHST